MIELTGLWLNESKSGEKYFSGRLGGGKVLIFKNKHKSEDKHPDYRMYVTEVENPREDSGSAEPPAMESEDTPF